ncbi:MAG: hypothetical protein HQK86_13950 [Nitrospinae bacterium]|nr:hypothetical protein [Nitrospinota bacterium]
MKIENLGSMSLDMALMVGRFLKAFATNGYVDSKGKKYLIDKNGTHFRIRGNHENKKP